MFLILIDIFHLFKFFMLKIIIVWFNEELNLNKLFKSILLLKWKIDYSIIYIDQNSLDSSREIALKNWANVILDNNYWYADPSKKRGYEDFVFDWERALILDCDEEITNDFVDELIFCIWNYEVWIIPLNVVFMNTTLSTAFQPRLFLKNSVIMTNDIHEYIKINSTKIYRFKSKIINNDIKDLWKYIFNQINKNNKYTDNELKKYSIKNYSKIRIVFMMSIMPLIWFFWWWLKRKMFFKWIDWLIFCWLMAFYQFTLFSKLYEIKTNKSL